MVARSFNETERQARARAEVDPATRDRITYAHEHAGTPRGRERFGGVLVRPSVRHPVTAPALRRAGLTIGEALAAGLVRP